MSSRNRYLDPTQRLNATCLIRALRKVEALVAGGERYGAGHRAGDDRFDWPRGALLDYAEIRDPETLEPIAIIDRPALAVLAVYFGTTRLIDNTILSPGEPGRGT